MMTTFYNYKYKHLNTDYCLQISKIFDKLKNAENLATDLPQQDVSAAKPPSSVTIAHRFVNLVVKTSFRRGGLGFCCCD